MLTNKLNDARSGGRTTAGFRVRATRVCSWPNRSTAKAANDPEASCWTLSAPTAASKLQSPLAPPRRGIGHYRLQHVWQGV